MDHRRGSRRRRAAGPSAPTRIAAARLTPIAEPSSPAAGSAAVLPESWRRRIVIEQVRPELDAGRYLIKRTLGERVEVTAHIFADGHDVLAAAVRYRLRPPGNPSAWAIRAGSPPADDRSADGRVEIPMEHLGNDEWSASFDVDTLGHYEYTVTAWVDRFETWRKHLSAKVDAGHDVASDLLEGAELVRETARATLPVRLKPDATTDSLRPKEDATAGDPAVQSLRPKPDSTERFAILPVRRKRDATRESAWLLEMAALIGGDAEPDARVAAALDLQLTETMARLAPRDRAVTYHRMLSVIVDRERARFGSWYETFPRSAGPDPTRSATFREAEGRLREIAEMGFDILYLPPIHPIGRTGRKGPGNTLASAPGDPGSPWAIGSTEGGHMAVEPGLGTLDDFDRFVRVARAHGLEIALDVAFHCSPDHPYVTEHPEWFRRRPDGTIKYAENPPKKYQDIYPFDFDTDAWQSLWDELKRIVLFWIDRGVNVFRVDNPHTKPFRFWEWLLAGIRAEHPDTIFLAEAFTRPKVMRALAKIGFNQSYTYFTWRNTWAELTDYFTELTQTEVREYMRPNLFANTPDILHEYLQRGGRAAFKVRLILAATLGASYGIYSGFELCEARGVPGTEEYLESEKYQYRRWDWDRPGHIKELIALVNRLRRQNRALQSDWSLRFHQTDNPNILFYSKATPDQSNVILVPVNLDPHHMQHGLVRVPIDDLGLSRDDHYEVQDLLDGARYRWHGDWNYVRLDPEVAPAHILRLRK